MGATIPEKTPLVASNFMRLPKAKEVNEFLMQLAQASPQASVQTLGLSAGGRSIDALLLSQDRGFLTDRLATPEKLTVMLIGSQHGTELAGGAAILIIAQKILTGELGEILENMNLVLVPYANPDGLDSNSRYNDAGENINIDYVALNLDETLNFVHALDKFKPQAVLDVHEYAVYKRVLSGDQGYVLATGTQFELANNPNINHSLQQFSVSELLPQLILAVEEKGLSANRYLGEINSLDAPVTGGGLSLFNFRNYSGLRGALSVLVEGRKDPTEDTYETPENIEVRVERQVIGILAFLEVIQKYKKQIISITNNAREHWITDYKEGKELNLKAEYALDEASPETSVPLLNLETDDVEVHQFSNHSNILAYVPTALPDAYAIVAEQDRMMVLLEKHGIDYEVIEAPQQLSGHKQKITNISIRYPQVGVRQFLDIKVDEENIKVDLKKGDLLVKTDQPFGIFVPLIFDLRSSDNIFQDISYRELLLKYREFFIFPVQLETTEK